MPFYAGWGLTHDAQAAPERRKPITLEQLAHAALVEYARYRHPETQQACEVEDLIEWVRFQRSLRARFASTLYAIDFSWNKIQSFQPDQRLLERATQLHAKIIDSGISKYNLGGKQWARPANVRR